MANIVYDTLKKAAGSNMITEIYGFVSDPGTQNSKIKDDIGGIYGFAVKLNKDEAKDFFNNYNEQKHAKTFDEWKELGNGFYPLYWG